MDTRVRWTELDFLGFCDPQISAFYRYWNGKRGGRRMPARADIDPAEIRQFLPAVMLLDVVDPASTLLRYRLVGTREAAARGGDPTGKLVVEAAYGPTVEYVVENYRMAIETRGPLYDGAEFPVPDSTLIDTGTIILPLSSDGRAIDQVIAFASLVAAPKSPIQLRRNAIARYPGFGRYAPLKHASRRCWGENSAS